MANDDMKIPTVADAEPPMLQEIMLGRNVSPVLQILLNDKLFDRVRMIAGYMSKAQGMIPRHLVGKSEACFAVVCRALTWRLDPFAVALATYQTPGGSVGFEGKLIAGILENSGRIDGAVQYRHFGRISIAMTDKTVRHFRSIDTDQIEAAQANGGKITATKGWESVEGKFEIATGQSGGQYAKVKWTREDAEGLGVVVFAKVKGEVNPREWEFKLTQAFPLNSPLWATDPKSQICYTATRRFANLAMPGVLMGVPFDREEESFMVDVTPTEPRPTRESFAGTEDIQVAEEPPAQDKKPAEPSPTFTVGDFDGSTNDFADADDAVKAMAHLLTVAAKHGEGQFVGIWESNDKLPGALRDAGYAPLADLLHEQYTKQMAVFDAAKKPKENEDEKRQGAAATHAPAAGAAPSQHPETGTGGAGTQAVLKSSPPSPIKGVRDAKHDPKAPLGPRVVWIVQKLGTMTPMERAEYLSTDPEIKHLENTSHWPTIRERNDELIRAEKGG